MDELLRKRLKFIRAGMETKRYHVVPTLGDNTVAHHSFGVALLAMELAQELTLDEFTAITMAALYHDLAEHRVGDLPADAKRTMGLSDVFSVYETNMLKEHLLDFALTPGLMRVLKFADCADGALFCTRERAMGNKLITPTFHNYRAYLNELNPRAGVEQDLVAFIDEEWTDATS